MQVIKYLNLYIKKYCITPIIRFHDFSKSRGFYSVWGYELLDILLFGVCVSIALIPFTQSWLWYYIPSFGILPYAVGITLSKIKQEWHK